MDEHIQQMQIHLMVNGGVISVQQYMHHEHEQ
jgi:hypothetical protein